MLDSYVLGTTLVETFLLRVQKTPLKEALRFKERQKWNSKNWQELVQAVQQMASFFYLRGLRFGDRVAFLAHTRADLFAAELAVQSLGGSVIPIYASNISEDILHILRESRAKLLVIESLPQYRKIQSLLPQLPELKTLLSLERLPVENCECLPGWGDQLEETPLDWAMTWKTICEKVTGDTLAALMFTSGTTGLPKAVSLTHKNFIEVLRGVGLTLDLHPEDTSLLFLPVAHIMGRVEQLLSLHVGIVNAYSGGVHSLKSDFIEVQPTILLAVPRIFEKILEGVQAHQGDGVAGEVLKWASKKSGLLKTLVDRQVEDRVRRGFGGRLRFALVGGAPLRLDVYNFFSKCGIQLLQGYGLTETAGPVSVNRPKLCKGDSVGKALSGVEIKILESGEILCRSPQISESILKDGWLETGDLGFLDGDGFLHITDRKKDLIITSNGKNIAPVKLESEVLKHPLFQSAIVVGHGMPFVSVLFVLDPERARRLALQYKIPHEDFAELKQNPIFLAYVQNELDQVNRNLAPFEVIRKFAILEQPLSVESGELTPTFKIRRQYCEKKYREIIDNLYGSGAP